MATALALMDKKKRRPDPLCKMHKQQNTTIRKNGLALCKLRKLNGNIKKYAKMA
jgi:hypothetical protein